MRAWRILAGWSIAACALWSADACAGWQNARLGASVEQFPAGWKATRRDENGFELHRSAVIGDYRYEESIGLGIARDNTRQIESVVGDLNQRGYALVDRSRLRLGATEVPFWFLFRQPSAEETAWLAVVLRGGVVFSLEMRSTPHDLNALADFGRVLQSFRFVPDVRERAWAAFLNGDLKSAAQGFDALLQENADDGNARYGSALTALAQGSPRTALRALERARVLLGVAEDTRRASARAYFELGDPGRAAILWLQVIRDNPGWDAELRPWVLRAASELRDGGQPRRVDDRVRQMWDDIGVAVTFFSGLADRVALGQPVSANPDQVENGRLAVREDLNRMFDELTAGDVRQADVRALLGALDVERAVDVIAGGFTARDATMITRGRVLLGAGMRALGETNETAD